MKEIVVHRNFTLNHGGTMKVFKVGHKYEVEDEEADHWYTRQHASIAGEKFDPEKPTPSHANLEPMRMIKGAPPFAVEAQPTSNHVTVVEEAPAPAPAAPMALLETDPERPVPEPLKSNEAPKAKVKK